MVEAKSSPILITGGAGFIGSEVARRLSGESRPVVVFDKRVPKENFPSSVGFEQGDLRDKRAFGPVLRRVRPGVIMHFASNIGPRGYLETHGEQIFRDNIAMDRTLYSSLEDPDVMVLHISSSMVFQNATTYPYVESVLPQIPDPTNLYGLAKKIGEGICLEWGGKRIILRYHGVYGPGEKPKGTSWGDKHVVPALLEKVAEGNLPLVILGDPTDTRPLTYLDDAVEATLQLLYEGLRGNPQVVNQDFNIGPEKTIEIRELYKLAWNLFGDGRPFSFVTQDIPGTTSHRREMNPRKIRQAVGWEPNVSLEEGLRLVFQDASS